MAFAIVLLQQILSPLKQKLNNLSDFCTYIPTRKKWTEPVCYVQKLLQNHEWFSEIISKTLFVIVDIFVEETKTLLRIQSEIYTLSLGIIKNIYKRRVF